MWNNSANLVAKMNRIFLVRMTLKKLSYWTLNLREWQISNYWMPIHALKILCQTFSTFVFFNKYLVMHIEWYCAFLLEIQIGRSLGCVQYTLCSLRCFNFVQFTVILWVLNLQKMHELQSDLLKTLGSDDTVLIIELVKEELPRSLPGYHLKLHFVEKVWGFVCLCKLCAMVYDIWQQ